MHATPAASPVRTILITLALVGGFVGVWRFTESALAALILVVIATQIALLVPFESSNGRTNYASIHFGQSMGMTARDRANMVTEPVTSRQRLEAAIVVGTFIALALVALVLQITN
jgi:hypothetical protein